MTFKVLGFLRQPTAQTRWRLGLRAALLAPLFFSGPVPDADAPVVVTWPRIHSGDEPHYLVMLNSAVRDRDLDVANNYAAVHRGGGDAGRKHAGLPLDPHVSWYDRGRIVYWWQIYHNDWGDWDRDASGRPVPRRRDVPMTHVAPPGGGADVPDRQFSWHPPGLPLLLSIVMFGLADPLLLEAGSLVLSGLVVVAAAGFFERLIRPLTRDSRDALLVTTAVFLGTPVWQYARTLFAEPYLLACAVGAYAVALRTSRDSIAGALVGIGVLIKPPFLLLGVPLVLRPWNREDLAGVIRTGLPMAAAVAGVLWLNDYMHGSPWRSSQAWEPGNPFEGFLGQLLSPTHGVLPFAPVAVIALAAWPRFLSDRPREAAVLLSGFLLYFGFMSCYVGWHGGYCYGPRYTVPVLPFLLASLCSVPDVGFLRGPVGRGAVIATGVASVALNAVGTFACQWSWGRHPLSLVAERHL